MQAASCEGVCLQVALICMSKQQTGTLLPTTLAPRVSHFKLVDLPTPSRTVDSQAGHRPDDAKRPQNVRI